MTLTAVATVSDRSAVQYCSAWGIAMPPAGIGRICSPAIRRHAVNWTPTANGTYTLVVWARSVGRTTDSDRYASCTCLVTGHPLTRGHANRESAHTTGDQYAGSRSTAISMSTTWRSVQVPRGLHRYDRLAFDDIAPGYSTNSHLHLDANRRGKLLADRLGAHCWAHRQL